MSTISASTTSTTAFKITTDTTGALVFQTGASPTTAMTLGSDQSVTFAGTPTYSGGTANGVAYLNGSKVLTTGSALTFSGGALGVTSSTTTALNLTGATACQINLNDGTQNANWGLGVGGVGITGIASPSTYPLVFYTNATERMRLDSSGNLGLGVTPSAWTTGGSTKALQITSYGAALSSYGGGNTWSSLTHNAYYDGTNWKYTASSVGAALYQTTGANAGSTHAWYTSAGGTAGNTITFTQAMTLDASGRLQVGNTGSLGSAYIQSQSTNANTVSSTYLWNATDTGIVLRNISNTTNSAVGLTLFGGSGGNAAAGILMVQETANSLGALVFYTGGLGVSSTVPERARIDSGGDWTFPFGWLKSFSAGGTPCLGIGTGDTGFMFIPAASAPQRIIPRNFAGTGADNTIDLGDAGSRYKTIYAATGTINTSDAREKTAVTPLTADELTAAAQIAASVGTYQWLQAVEEKGAAARHHAGLTVQRAIEIMEVNNLDPFAYGFICYDSWQTEEYDGQVLRVAGDRYSFRMDELSLFIARGQQALIETLTSRIAALENK